MFQHAIMLKCSSILQLHSSFQ
jgi:hypothetical protein